MQCDWVRQRVLLSCRRWGHLSAFRFVFRLLDVRGLGLVLRLARKLEGLLGSGLSISSV